ncbi:MAG: exodeoxyribonuclease VII large subunit [Saprospiraceae bacterium]|nr:exodeoxyribonuclease VII large subunit [Saprospiraceae bacterium]
MKVRSLFELHEHLRRVVALNFLESLWVRCEIAAASKARGHYFLSLVQKKEADELQIIAQAEGIIWENTLSKWRRQYGRSAENVLQAGLEVAFKVKMDFHERYGLKLHIEDIDLAYTVGQLELLRRETLAKLDEKGLIGKNARLTLPKVIQRIAVLSSEQAAGYQDFTQHLLSNSFGYQFRYQLFGSAVQGESAQKEILSQLAAVKKHAHRFDAVVITRGGGARLDLAAFDDFKICEAIAHFPLPVLTGIGHEVDEAVADRVAHHALKTPTAVADFILQHNAVFESEVLEAVHQIHWQIQRILKQQTLSLQQLAAYISLHRTKKMEQQYYQLDAWQSAVPRAIQTQLFHAKQHLEQLARLNELLSIAQNLERGFALVLKDGKRVTTASALKSGETITLQLADGNVQATILSTT